MDPATYCFPTAQAAAQAIGMHPRTMQKKLKEGEIKGVQGTRKGNWKVPAISLTSLGYQVTLPTQEPQEAPRRPRKPRATPVDPAQPTLPIGEPQGPTVTTRSVTTAQAKPTWQDLPATNQHPNQAHRAQEDPHPGGFQGEYRKVLKENQELKEKLADTEHQLKIAQSVAQAYKTAIQSMAPRYQN